MTGEACNECNECHKVTEDGWDAFGIYFCRPCWAVYHAEEERKSDALTMNAVPVAPDDDATPTTAIQEGPNAAVAAITCSACQDVRKDGWDAFGAYYCPPCWAEYRSVEGNNGVQCNGCKELRTDGWHAFGIYFCVSCWVKHNKEKGIEECKKCENWSDNGWKHMTTDEYFCARCWADWLWQELRRLQRKRPVCDGCRNPTEGGWKASNGAHYCSVCWNDWVGKLADSKCDCCQRRISGGAHVRDGTYYCGACWLQLEAIPGVPLSADNKVSKHNSRNIAKRFLSSYSCRCCGPPAVQWRPSTENEISPRMVPGLEGVPYCDAHCHLDILLQNQKQGGPGWDFRQKLCKFWLAGTCPYDDDCCFAHGQDKIVPRIGLDQADVKQFVESHAFVGSKEQKPHLRSMITNCVEREAIADTRTLLDVANSLCPGLVYSTFGCHPHMYNEWSDEWEALILEQLAECGSQVVGWGECGLDYYKNHDESLSETNRAAMVNVFVRQVKLAVWHRLPLVVHSRDADEDTLSVLTENLPRYHKVHLHAFQGSVKMMRACLEQFPNCVFGVSGQINGPYPSEEARQIARLCPLDRLVLETDAPYLGTGPCDIVGLARKVAELRGLGDASVAEVLRQTSENCEWFYGLPRHGAAEPYREAAASAS